MAIAYRFLDRSDEALLAASELPVDKGIAVSVLTTGYELGTDEIVGLSIADLDGTELFSQLVKPQNIENWNDDAASGGISPSNVEDAPELYQFEDEIRELFDNAPIVVGQHVGFVREMIETSWVALPDFDGFDLIEQFCASHSSLDYPGQPAAVVALDGIAGYYGVPCEEDTPLATARTIAACYRQFVDEHVRARAEKGSEYWQRYQERLEEAEREDAHLQTAARNAQVRTIFINAILWLCAAAIFSNLSVQLYLRDVNLGFVVVSAAAAIFFAVHWALSLYAIYKLRKQS